MSVRNDIFDSVMTALDALKTDTYEADVREIQPFHENYLTKFAEHTPLLMAVDQGNDERLVYDTTHSLFSFNVSLWAYISEENWASVQEKFNEILASIKQLIYSSPTLDSHVVAWQFIEGLGSYFDGSKSQAHIGIQTRILYYCENGSF